MKNKMQGAGTAQIVFLSEAQLISPQPLYTVKQLPSACTGNLGIGVYFISERTDLVSGWK